MDDEGNLVGPGLPARWWVYGEGDERYLMIKLSGTRAVTLSISEGEASAWLWNGPGCYEFAKDAEAGSAEGLVRFRKWLDQTVLLTDTEAT